MRELRTDAVILDTLDVFDADRLYLMFTREFGKLRARAKGVRRPTSRLTGHLLRFMPVSLSLSEKNGWYLVTQASGGGGSYPEDSLGFLQAAELLAEGVDAIMVENQPHPAVYDSLEYVVVRLRETTQPILLVAEFLFKSLCALGYAPQLDRSVVSGETLDPDELAWSNELGGVANRAEISEHINAIPVDDPKIIVALRQFAKPAFIAERLQMDEATARATVNLVLRFVQFQAGKDLKSARFVS